MSHLRAHLRGQLTAVLKPLSDSTKGEVAFSARINVHNSYGLPTKFSYKLEDDMNRWI